MKRFTLFSIAFMLVACLFVGCGGDDDDDDALEPGGVPGSAFASMKAGDWAEHSDPDGDRDISKYLGDDTWEGRVCILMEFESYYSGEQTITQMWMDKATGEIVLFLIKENGKVMRMDISTPPEVPGEDETWEEPNTEKIGTDKYTTPTGKTVDVTIYRTQTTYGVTEDWVSDEVPFNRVKNLMDGQLWSSLYDFGTGATRGISKQEAENAEAFSFDFPDIPNDPGNPVDPGNPADPGMPQQDGQITITVGPGPRPTISVSQPIKHLLLTGPGFSWEFITDQALFLPGPFQYGVVPNGANLAGNPNPADLQAGVAYTIVVFGEPQGFIPVLGMLELTR